jgi:hypothetical protein
MNAILEQLGGNRFLAMTGARHLVGNDQELRFSLPRGCRDGINKIVVKLDAATDTYTVTAYKLRGVKCDPVGEPRALVYADQLQAIFATLTGLDTHL